MPATVMTPEQFEQWLARTYAEAVAMPTKPVQLRALAVKARADIQGHITSGIDAQGSPFKPLAFDRPRGGTKPLMDTGRLRASITGETIPDGVKAGTNHPQAGILNDGGTIHAKKKFLAIPVTRQAQLVGSPLRFPKSLVFRGSGAKGALMLPKGKGKRARLETQYILKRSVSIPKREYLYFSQSFIEFAENMILDLMAKQFLR